MTGRSSQGFKIIPWPLLGSPRRYPLPVFTLAVFYRPSKTTEYVHIDALFGEPGKNVIDLT
ncbi:hypothetical protein GCM10009574_096900 [Streptomyces asiaticus]|uniref:Uncharacterized protein n=2 Tax=Streptomyces rhizosphaericus TaxID=114699 RepID=A0ABN1SPR3_9ACTN